VKTVITGGGGFLGRKLAARLLKDQGHAELVLCDQSSVDYQALADHEAVTIISGDITDPATLASLIDSETETVFHLASVVSAGAEQDFDLGYAVNLQGTIALLERCREVQQTSGHRVRVVFASSVATFGSGAGDPVDDHTAQRPETSYGVHKTCCELLLNDYHRRGFIDGRGLRLPTVSVRPGKPNLAASGFASGIIREPLNGVDMVCPVSPDTKIAVISPRRVIDGFSRIATIDDDVLGPDRTLMLPGLAMSMTAAVEAVQVEGEGRQLGNISFEVDPDVQRIVDSWPSTILSDRAVALGLVGDHSVAAIVRQHIQDELEH
jgi:nucleoside-diphosphate-sugar epimerase